MCEGGLDFNCRCFCVLTLGNLNNIMSIEKRNVADRRSTLYARKIAVQSCDLAAIFCCLYPTL